ncbi:MAG: DUF4402 domain-containing protein [Rhodospirillales bacterium]
MKRRLQTAGKPGPTLLQVAVFAAAVLAPAAASAATARAFISVVVPQLLSVGMTSGMNFGAVAPNGGGAGEVTLSPTGERQGTNVDLIGGGTGTPASFALSGGPNQAYAISLPDGTTIANGATSIRITAFTHNAGASPSLKGDGSQRVNVGATLRIERGGNGDATSGASGAPNPKINVVISYN